MKSEAVVKKGDVWVCPGPPAAAGVPARRLPVLPGRLPPQRSPHVAPRPAGAPPQFWRDERRVERERNKSKTEQKKRENSNDDVIIPIKI
jgi:hypothetical protein